MIKHVASLMKYWIGNMVGFTGGSRKYDARRWRANCRERARMHSLNAALERLKLSMPIDMTVLQKGSVPHKLSKIETLRLAINYISALNSSLTYNPPPDMDTFCGMVTAGLGHQTALMVSGGLRTHSFQWTASDLCVTGHCLRQQARDGDDPQGNAPLSLHSRPEPNITLKNKLDRRYLEF